MFYMQGSHLVMTAVAQTPENIYLASIKKHVMSFAWTMITDVQTRSVFAGESW